MRRFDLRHGVAKRDAPIWRNGFLPILAAALLAVLALGGPQTARAGGACSLVPSDRDPSEKILQCGQELTVRPAPGARYQPLYKKGQPLPAGVRLDSGALLIDYRPNQAQPNFQILTPLAIAAVRGTKWAMEVSPMRTSTLVLSGEVAVTSRRLNQYVVLTEGLGVDISPSDTTLARKQWGQSRVRALLSRFGE